MRAGNVLAHPGSRNPQSYEGDRRTASRHACAHRTPACSFGGAPWSTHKARGDECVNSAGTAVFLWDGSLGVLCP